MRYLLLLTLFLAALFAQRDGIADISRAPYELSKQEVHLINGIASYLVQDAEEDDLDRIRELLVTDSEVVGALAAVILFRHKPEVFTHSLFDRYAVRDYSLRRQGKYNMIGSEEILEVVHEIEKKNNSIQNPDVVLLIVFLHFRNSNQWFADNGMKVSAARFFRTAFLTGALRGTSLNSADLANAIDMLAQHSTP